MMKVLLFIAFVLVFSSGCFSGIDKQGSVVGYSPGLVRTLGGSFRIGPLSPDWETKKIKYRAVLFENRQDHSTITIDSWCQRAFDDRSLEVLSQQLLKGMTDMKVVKSERLMLDGRDALNTEVQARMDGQDVYVNLVVLKMNTCVFDFFYVSKPQQLNTLADFKAVVLGFGWREGPGLL